MENLLQFKQDSGYKKWPRFYSSHRIILNVTVNTFFKQKFAAIALHENHWQIVHTHFQLNCLRVINLDVLYSSFISILLYALFKDESNFNKAKSTLNLKGISNEHKLRLPLGSSHLGVRAPPVCCPQCPPKKGDPIDSSDVSTIQHCFLAKIQPLPLSNQL